MFTSDVPRGFTLDPQLQGLPQCDRITEAKFIIDRNEFFNVYCSHNDTQINTYFDNVGSKSYKVISMFLKRVYNCAVEKQVPCHFNIVTTAVSNIGQETVSTNDIRDYMRNATTDPYAYDIRYTNIKRGYTKLYTALDENPSEDYTRLTELEPILTLSHGENTRIYQTKTGAIRIYSNVQILAFKTLLKIISMIPVFFQTLKSIIEDDFDATVMANSFYEYDDAAFVELIHFYDENLVSIREQLLYTTLTNKLKQGSASVIRTLETKIVNLRNDTESHLSYVAENNRKIAELQKTHLGYLISENTVDLSAIQSIKNSKTVKLKEVTSNHLKIEVTTPILYYNTRDVEMYFKRNEPNPVNQPGWFASMMKDVFINKKAVMICKDTISIPWNAGNASWGNGSQKDDYISNPHICFYNCYSPAKAQANAAMANNDITMAINSVVAACASIAFTDGAVIRSLCGELKDGEWYGCENFKTPSGNMFSAEAYNIAYDKGEKALEELLK